MDKDRNLLFGVLAVQLRKVTSSQLMAAAAAWATDGSKDLAERLLEDRVISKTDVDLLQRLVDEAINAHSGNATQALQSLGGDSVLRATFGPSIDLLPDGSDKTASKSFGAETPERYLDAERVPGVQETPGRYSHVSEYGRGGMGRVLLVHDAFLGRDVALKELLPGPSFSDPESPATPVRRYVGYLSRFLQEARITGQLEHPAIVPVYELGHRKDGTLYYTMKLVRGRTLRDAIRHCRTLRDRLNLLPHFVDLCQAVAYAHSRGVIHRDIKPDNVMVGEFGETVVLDWGLAKTKDREDVHADGFAKTIRLLNLGDVESAAKTQYGQILGTPAYMAPEQAKGQLEWVDERSDVYSLGAVLYELLSGRAPFSGNVVVEILHQVIRDEPKALLPEEAPPELAAICAKAMQKTPGRRYHSARDLANEVLRFQSGALVKAHRYTPAQLMTRFVRRYRPILATSAAAFALVVAVTAVYVVQITQKNRTLTGLRDEAIAERRNAEAARDAENVQKETAEAARKEAEAQRDKADRLSYVFGIRGVQANIRAGETAEAYKQLLALPAKFRNWEWGHYYKSLDQSQLTLSGHAAPVIKAVYSPDGRRILTASSDGTARIWSSETGELLHSMEGHVSEVLCATFSKDGQRVATGSLDRTAKVWDANTGQELLTLTGHTFRVYQAEFSNDGQRIVTASKDKSARIWDANTGTLLHTLAGHAGEVKFSVFSPDDRKVLTTSDDGKAFIWDANSGQQLLELGGGSGSIHCAVFSPDSKRVLVSSAEFSVKIWDAESGKLLSSLLDDRATVTSAVFSAEGRRVLTANIVGEARIWEASTGKETNTLTLTEPDSWFNAFAKALFLPDEKRVLVAATDNPPIMFDIVSGKKLAELKGHTKKVRDIAISPDGRHAVTASDDCTAKLWDVTAIATKPTGSTTNREIIAAAFSSDGNRLLTAYGDAPADVWNASTGARLATLSGDNVSAIDAEFNSKGTRILSISNDNSVRIWDAESGALQSKFLPGNATLAEAVFTPDGQSVLTRQVNGIATTWDIEAGKTRCSYGKASENITRTMFSPDRQLLFIAAEGGQSRVWNTASGEELFVLPPGANSVSCAEFSPDSRSLLTGFDNNSAELWDARTGKALTSFSGHGSRPTSAAFADDGRRLITTAYSQVILWETQTGKKISEPGTDWSEVKYAQFIPGNRLYAVTSFSDGKMRFYDCDTGGEFCEIDGKFGSVDMGSFSSDGRRLLRAETQGMPKLWDIETGKEVAPVAGLTGNSLVTGNPQSKPNKTDSMQEGISAPIAQFSPDGRRIFIAEKLPELKDSVAKLLDSAVWDPAAWQDDLRRSEVLQATLCMPPQVIATEVNPDSESGIRMLADFGNARMQGEGMRHVAGQGILVTDPPSIAVLGLQENDILVRVNSAPATTVETLGSAMRELLSKRGKSPELPSTLRLEIANSYNHRIVLVTFSGVIRQEIRFTRKAFSAFCSFTADGVRAAKKELEGGITENVVLSPGLAAKPLGLQSGDDFVEWDGVKITGYDSLADHEKDLSRKAADGTITRSQLTVKRQYTNQYVHLTIYLD